MKPASAALIALLTPGAGAQKFVHADLYTWTMAGGDVSRYTSADIDLVVSGHSFSSANGLFARGKTGTQLGLQVPELEITVMPRPTDLINGVAWLSAARAGSLDGATVLVERFISDSWTNTAVGSLYQFSGKIAALAVDRTKLVAKIVAPLIQLNQQLPRNMFQTTCVHTLYDAGCTLSRAAFTAVASVVGGSSQNQVLIASGAAPTGYFSLGSLTFLTGALAGLQRTIDSYSNDGVHGIFNLPLMLPSAPAPGDTFSVYPGCNKVLPGDCTNKFGNQANFKGTPFVPLAETAY